MDEKMDDSDLALEQAIGKIDSGDDFSSGSDRESETPAPVRMGPGRPDPDGSLLNGCSYQQGPERAMEEGGGGSGGSGSTTGAAAGGEREAQSTLHVPRSQVTLDVIFVDYKLFTMFRRFLKDQCIMRNLNFWLACKHYHQLTGGTPESQDHLHKVAKAIYFKYIKLSAPQLVQVKASTRRTIKSILDLNPKTLSSLLFKTAQGEVWELMERNEMRQFLASDVFCEVFGEVEDSMSMELSYTPAGPVLRRASPLLHQSSSEDSVSVTSCSTDGGGSELGQSLGNRLRPPFHRSSQRACSSDTETKSYRSYVAGRGPHVKKDKPVSKEDFVAMVCERLTAVQKDRDHMRKRAQETARQQGRSYDDIMATDWYDLPNAIKYDRFDSSSSRHDSLRGLQAGEKEGDRGYGRGEGIPPSSHSPSLVPYPHPNSNLEIDSLGMSEIQDALKDLEITNQVNRNRRHHHHHHHHHLVGGHPGKSSSAASSLLSYTSDSGVGDSGQWGGTTNSSLVAASRHVQRFVEGQNQLLSKTPQREIAAKAAAITLINSSPHPEDLVHRVHPSMSGRHRLHPHQLTRTTNYSGAYSSDDSGSFITVTSESDLFIPRRFPAANYSESDEPHHYTKPHHRQLSRPRPTRFKMQPTHQTPTIMEPSHTPTSHTPRPPAAAAAPPTSGAEVLVVYDLVDPVNSGAKRDCKFAKKYPSNSVTLAEFKEKIFGRKGQYRFFFKTIYEGIDEALMEEISDEETVLPHYEGKIVARVESVA